MPDASVRVLHYKCSQAWLALILVMSFGACHCLLKVTLGRLKQRAAGHLKCWSQEETLSMDRNGGKTLVARENEKQDRRGMN